MELKKLSSCSNEPAFSVCDSQEMDGSNFVTNGVLIRRVRNKYFRECLPDYCYHMINGVSCLRRGYSENPDYSVAPFDVVAQIPFNKLPNKISLQYANVPDGNFSLKEARHLNRLYTCGNWADVDCYHRACGEHLKNFKTQIFCGSRYCLNIDCIILRFIHTLRAFESIKELSDFRNVKIGVDEDGKNIWEVQLNPNRLRNLWHFSIGFELISEFDFRNNFSQIKKDMEYSLNTYWSRLKKKGVEIRAIRVLDFAFTHKDGSVFPHYHYGACPPKLNGKIVRSKADWVILMKIINEVRDSILSHSHRCLSFRLKSFKYKKKSGVLAYLSKRSAGIYKYGEEKNRDFNSGEGRLRKDLESNKYFGLQDVLTVKEYLNHFHGKRHYVTVGGLPRGSIPTDNIESKYPKYCPYCDVFLEKKDVRVEMTLNTDPPPDFRRN